MGWLQDAEDNWAFDIFALADATNGKALSMLTFHLLQQTGLVRDLRLDESKLRNYLQKIEAGYDSSNPYHNRCPSRPCTRQVLQALLILVRS